MATVDNPTNPTATRHAFASLGLRWLGAGALGMVAWILLSVLTALLDPRPEGAGLIGAFHSLGAFLATGAALTVVPMIAYAIHRHGFGQRATIGVAGVLAALVIVLVVMNWQIILAVFAGASILALMLKYGSSDSDRDGFHWRYAGLFGSGYYVGDWRVDDDDDWRIDDDE